MKKTQLLLTQLQEEAAETSQRASKAIRFTLEEIQPGQPLNNAQRIVEEFSHMVAVMELLQEDGQLEIIIDRSEVEKKKRDIMDKHMNYSRTLGVLTE